MSAQTRKVSVPLMLHAVFKNQEHMAAALFLLPCAVKTSYTVVQMIMLAKMECVLIVIQLSLHSKSNQLFRGRNLMHL